MTYTIHPLTQPNPGLPVAWAILHADGETGYIVGDDSEVTALLTTLLSWQQGQHAQAIDHQDERLGWVWLTTGEAIALAIDLTGEEIPHRTLTYACSAGLIPGAKRVGRDWAFSQARFLHWLHNRPKPGPKPAA